MKKLNIKLVKSLIGRTDRQKDTVKALGLTKINSTAVHTSTPQIMGMIDKVKFLLEVNEIAE
jgi:large subunit ribosomal protein L30